MPRALTSGRSATGSIHHTEAKILGLAVALDAPIDMVEDLCAALGPRIVAHRNETAADVIYQVRDQLTHLDVVCRDGSSCELIDTADSVGRAAELIANDVHRWVAEHHPDLLVVHAGVVEWRGIGIVVPGRSHSGKSSLIAALLRAGAGYLSDEFAPLDLQGNVHPYPRHLSLRDGRGGSTLVPAADFGARTANELVPVRYVVDAPYDAGSTFEPVRVRGAAALMCLAENALVARSRPEHTMAIVAALAPNAIVLRSSRGDAAAAARTILDTIDADPLLT